MKGLLLMDLVRFFFPPPFLSYPFGVDEMDRDMLFNILFFDVNIGKKKGRIGE